MESVKQRVPLASVCPDEEEALLADAAAHRGGEQG